MQSSLNLTRLAKNVPVVRGFAYEVSPYHTGSVLENRLGLQVLRMVGKRLAWRLRRARVEDEIKPFAEVLHRDGVLVLPDFLTPEEFAAVLREIESLRPSMRFGSFRETGDGRVHVARYELGERGTDCPAIRRYLQENSLIQSLAAATIRRPITSPPRVLISFYRQAEEDAAIDNDLENILHADLHAATVKAFFYLNEIDRTNGAFVYAKGSHHLTLERLRHEYDLSIRTAKLARGDRDIPEHLLAWRGPHRRGVIAEKYLRRMHITETPVCGRANTLVVANNMGFHRRGEFTGAASRETILLNFRHFERCFW